MKYNLNLFEKDLKNGMHVILVHKPDYHKSLFLLGAGVGGFDINQKSNDRTYAHRSGLAHYLEHQMFYLDGEDVSDIFAGLQCSTNAYTSYNETAFYFSTTADIYKPLKVLMDFVENLDITKDTVEKERGIILSEYDMYQQSPEQRLFKETLRSLYKYHPMKIDVLGDKSDIVSMSIEDLETFYHLNYDPSCLCMIGITPEDPDEVFAYIESCQEAYPSQLKSLASCVYPEEPMQVNRVFYSEEMDIHQPFVCVAYKLRPIDHIDQANRIDHWVNMWLDSIMGPMNPEYQKWLDARIFTQFVGAEADFTCDHAYILFYAQTNKVDAFVDLVKSLVKEPKMDADAFASLKAQSIATSIRGMNQFDGLANDLLRAYFGGYRYLDVVDLVKSTTIEDVNATISNLNFENVCVTQIMPIASNLDEVD